MTTIVKSRVKFLHAYKELIKPSKRWRNLIYHGGRYSGKSYHVALSLILRTRNEKLRVLCTREVQNTIKDSVHKLLKDIIEKYKFDDFEVTNDSVKNRLTGSEFIFKGLRQNINEIKSTEGIDVCWVEEAQSVSDKSWDILTPTIRKENSIIVVTFNRYNELDPVYTRFVLNRPPNTYVLKVNYDVLEKADLVTKAIYDEIEADKVNPDLYAHKWLGEPLGQQDRSIIDRSAILTAMQRDIADDGKIIVGADIARMGNDRTVFFKRKGFKVIDYKIHNKLRTTQVCDMLESFAGYDKSVEIKIDDTGVGGGVTDEMYKRKYAVVPINFGAKAKDADKYPNLISEAWFEMSDIINQIQLPYDSDLLMELSTRQWKQDARGKRAVEGKSEYKKRGFRSPDIADACIICFYTPLNNSITADDIYMY